MSRGSRFTLPWMKVFEPTGASEWGMHILVDKDTVDPMAIDIIAIHGLNGNWDTTWTDESTGTNWLRHSIPKRLKTARVMSFSYNSSVLFSKSVSNVSDFAEQLLENLEAQRVSEVERDRPMLFICHSLGGIVFKRACNQAYQKDRYKRLLGAVTGVAFFGTPHRGSSIASLGKVFSCLVKAASFGTNTNTQLLKELERGSPVLDEITTTYANRKYDFKICSFYETDKMDFLSSVVVDRHSAVLGIEGETVVPINGNHRSICRFTSKDTRMPVVLENLIRMVKDKIEIKQEGLERLFLERLGPPDHLLHKERNPSPTQGTCSWALSHPEFLRWHESKGPALLWFSASPGCGKSVLMSFLIDHFRSTIVSKHIHLCYWFFKSDNQRQRSAISAVRGLLRQLVVARRSNIPTLHNTANDGGIDTLQDVWKLFIHAVRMPPAEGDDDGQSRTAPIRHTTVCLIDGLDECESDAKRDLILLFQSYFDELRRVDPGTKSKTLKQGFLKVLIASRPENWIKLVFDQLNRSMYDSGQQQLKRDEPVTRYCAIRLKAEDESSLISADISLVVRAAIADLVAQGLPKVLLHNIQKQLIARADRTFIWITLIIDLLKEKVENGASRSELDKILESRTVDQIFTEILRERPNAERTRKLFSVLLAAARPLMVEELSIILALTPEHSALSKSPRPFRPSLQSFERLKIQAASQRHTLSDHEGTIINYVSTAWYIHFNVVVDHIDPPNIPYYHNLCHPKFPGFKIWIEESWDDEINPYPTVGMNNHEIQDFYIKMYHLEQRRFKLGCSDDYEDDINEIRDLEDDEESNVINQGYPIPKRKLLGLNLPDDLNTQQVLHSNPTARPNHHFPLTVDKCGFVSIDYNGGR
ncbi:hypothetical protein NPX13_g253 [Xylaria arbuscula]|uniref:Nephrocystin 3-like N-terminal domain-containing protein n=1 Tax=Xylaria arbuscula TaxID=114810 RepID=A0A9W8NP73_9PEZI|nr:hypothetical protein NPX13_g253 [Xylaria arbuscula]